MSVDETLNIDTPENVTFDYVIAGVGSRFVAALIDTVIILMLQVITNVLIWMIIGRLGILGEGGASEFASSWAIALVGLIAFLFLWGYYIFFEMLWNGQSPGKRAVKLRVIRTDGTPITLTESIIRNLVRLVDFLPAFYGVGSISIFINGQTRRLGDLAAGTLVVYDKKQQITLKDLAVMNAPSRAWSSPVEPGPLLPRAYPVERLDYQDIQLIESFFQRQRELLNHGVLAGQLLKRLLAKMGVPEEAGALDQPETTLKTILDEYRRLRQPD